MRKASAMMTPFGKSRWVAGQKRIAETSAARHHAAHENVARFAVAEVHIKNPTNRAEDRDAAEHERVNDRGRRRRESERADEDRADQAHCISLENVGRHPGAIAHVVAHVVGDRRRISRIVFVERVLDFPYEIGAHVSRLRVNAAAQSRENADQTRAQGETDKAAHCSCMADHAPRDRVEEPDGEQRQPDHKETCDRAAIERDPQRRGARFGRRLRRAGVGENSDPHSDKTRRERAGRADDEADRGGVILKEEKENENDDLRSS